MTIMKVEIVLNKMYEEICGMSRGKVLGELMYLRDKGYIDEYEVTYEEKEDVDNEDDNSDGD